MPESKPNLPRTLVLCFDGTSNEYDSENTNVVKFFSLLKKDDFREQLCYYQAGVGTFFNPGIVSPLFEWLAKLADQAIAWYLDHHVMEGYRFIMQNYRIGDKICLFGFSRGAYTARALGGMLHKVGLLPKDNHQQIPFAYKLYAREDPVGIKLCAGFKETYCQDVGIEFVGVWDTVASVGIITGRSLPFVNSNTAIKTFRHALSLDERRAKFRPNTYQYPTDEASPEIEREQHSAMSEDAETNESSPMESDMCQLHVNSQSEVKTDQKRRRRSSNAGVGIIGRLFGGHKDQRKLKTSAMKSRDQMLHPENGTDVLEVWFAGCHCDVGGGAVKNSTPNSLANISLRWMVREAMAAQCGIQFDEAALTRLDIPVTFSAVSSAILKFTACRDSIDLSTEGIPSLITDTRDAMQPMHDQLEARKVWWGLEFTPLHYSWQDSHGIWQTSFGLNLGKGRDVLDERPSLHYSVKLRMNDPILKYKPKAKWNVGQERWVM